MIKTLRVIFFDLVIISLTGCIATDIKAAQPVKGVFIDFTQTEKVKARISEKQFRPAYSTLIERAEIALTEGPFSVMQKKQVPPSGDKHDYMSIGPYWWPDSAKITGQPYIRKDGYINPEFLDDQTDVTSKNKMFSNVETLTWATYFSDERKYAEKAVELLKVWFINPETRMNPNLNYAQGIPGICDGRGIGIIDWSSVYILVAPIQILDARGFLPPETKQPLFSWFKRYLDWLIDSNFGKEIDNFAKNNHATWFDVQVAGIALMLGENPIAQTRLEQTKFTRIATQIEPDGSQPHELTRTQSLSYTAMNLRGFILLAILAGHVDVDLWNFRTNDGRSILKALEFLEPYVLNKREWPFTQISGSVNTYKEIKYLFQIAFNQSGNSHYQTVAEFVEGNQNDLMNLLYPAIKEN